MRKWIFFSGLLISLFIPSAVFASTVPYGAYLDEAGTVSDDGKNLYVSHFEAAYHMKSWGIFDGYADGTFGPTREINRAEMAKVLTLATGVDAAGVQAFVADYDAEHGTDDYFSDIDLDEWYAPYVRYAQIKGWMSGYPDGTYKPANSTLICEVLKMILESQYGTPDASYTGEHWYEVYVNPLLDLNFLYTVAIGAPADTLEEFETLAYTFNSDSAGRVDEAATRKDVAELIYRVRSVLEANGGELGEYDPYLTVEAYETLYGAQVTETDEGMISVDDPYFDFHIENIYIKDFDLAQLRISVSNPSGFSNGYVSGWSLMYPSMVTDMHYSDYSGNYYNPVFGLANWDPAFKSVMEEATGTDIASPTVTCMGRAMDLWDIYSVMCGQVGENKDDLEDLLAGELTPDLSDGDFLVSVHQYSELLTDFRDEISDVLSDYHYYYEDPDKLENYLEYVSYFVSTIESTDDEQIAAYGSWYADYFASIGSYMILRELYADEEALARVELSEAYGDTWDLEYDLRDMVKAYESSVFAHVTEEDRFVIEVPVSECQSSDSDYVVCGSYVGGWGLGMILLSSDNLRVVSGDVWDYFESGAISIFIPTGSVDDLDLLENTSSEAWIRITVQAKPLDSLAWYDADWPGSYLLKWEDGLYYQKTYYNEIVKVEWAD